MKVELDNDEAWNLMSHIIGRMIEETDLSDTDRARIRRWKSDEMRVTSQEMKVLTTGNILPPDSTISTSEGTGGGRVALTTDGTTMYRVKVTTQPLVSRCQRWRARISPGSR